MLKLGYVFEVGKSVSSYTATNLPFWFCIFCLIFLVVYTVIDDIKDWTKFFIIPLSAMFSAAIFTAAGLGAPIVFVIAVVFAIIFIPSLIIYFIVLRLKEHFMTIRSKDGSIKRR